ncbi:MAG: radical SAM protein [Rhodospirillales bacterium]|nr:radical SAM protein [Rhodospirillales bacterium]
MIELEYDFPLWRPPSEGENLILQASLGCSFNGCTFCSMYKTKRFAAKPLERLFAEIDQAARDWPDAHRVFLADGDALVLPTDHLLRILERLALRLPNLARVAVYATPVNLWRKSEAELAALKAHKLSLIYLGIESGSGDILRRIRKGTTPQSMAGAIARGRAAGLKISATVILGLGGRRRWQDHIDETAGLINQAPPHYLSTLQLRLAPEVQARFQEKFGEPFEPQDDAGMLAEQARLIAALDPPRPIIFRSNHASNALPLAGTLPKDRPHLLAQLGAAGRGEIRLRPRIVRGL